jgi:hypothetical protein
MKLLGVTSIMATNRRPFALILSSNDNALMARFGQA